MTHVIIGANGQLGSDLLEVLQREPPPGGIVGLTHDEIEIADAQSVARALSNVRPHWVINTAAFHNVPRCEEEPDRAFAVNARGAWHLARTCAELGAGLLHVSTDYVFDGNRNQPYVEQDLPGPLNVYGVTKLAGEHLIRATLPRHLIVRTCGLYGVHPCRAKAGESFVDTILRLARERGESEVFVAGGAKVYAEALPLADRLVLTRVAARVDGDTCFPSWDPALWKLVSETHHGADDRHAFAFVFQEYVRTD